VSQTSGARKSSYLFLALGFLAPFVTGFYIDHVRRTYEARTGFPPDGIGLAGIMFLGAVVTLIFFLGATTFAAISFARVGPPRPLKRKIELALFCLPPAFIVLCCLGFWYVANHPEPRVYEFPVPQDQR